MKQNEKIKLLVDFIVETLYLSDFSPWIDLKLLEVLPLDGFDWSMIFSRNEVDFKILRKFLEAGKKQNIHQIVDGFYASQRAISLFKNNIVTKTTPDNILDEDKTLTRIDLVRTLMSLILPRSKFPHFKIATMNGNRNTYYAIYILHYYELDYEFKKFINSLFLTTSYRKVNINE